MLSEKANRMQIMSRDQNEVLVYRDLWHESPMDTTASFHWDSAGTGVTYLYAKSGAAKAFGVKFTSVTDDGIVRFQIANASALPVTKVVGVLEWISRKKDKDGQSKFVVDQKMDPGAWISVAVATSLSGGELWYFQLKDIAVGSTFFK